MKDLELNKVLASILFVAIIMLSISVVVDSLYQPSITTQRGFQVEISTGSDGEKVKEELDIPTLLANANIEKGKVVAKKCIACHTFNKGDRNKVGPNLWGIVGSKHAHLDDFNYSKAMSSHVGVWGYDELFHFLKRPQGYIAGTKMAFAGISKPEQIADIIIYLRSMSDSSLPLPLSVENTR